MRPVEEIIPSNILIKTYEKDPEKVLSETLYKKYGQRSILILLHCRFTFVCTEDQRVSAFLLTSLGVLGISANIILILVICFNASFKR